MAQDFDRMPAPPASATGSAVFTTLLHAAAYRFRWASDSLPDSLATFRPAPTSRSMGELMAHLCELAERLQSALETRADANTAQQASSSHEPPSLGDHRRRALDALAGAIRAVAGMDEDALNAIRLERPSGEPFELWNLLHGPLADFLTHVGQVASWRRIAGFPPPAPRVFAGLPPNDDAPAPSDAGSSGPNARDSRIHDEDWTESSFHDVTLTGARFDDVSLAGAKFHNVTFAGATLNNVDLSNVNITDANVEGLRLDGELLRP